MTEHTYTMLWGDPATEKRIAEIWPHRVRARTHEIMNLLHWCNNNGAGISTMELVHTEDGTVYVLIDEEKEWGLLGDDFFFKDKDLAFEFKMRFG